MGGNGGKSGGDMNKMLRDHDNMLKNLRYEVNQLHSKNENNEKRQDDMQK